MNAPNVPARPKGHRGQPKATAAASDGNAAASPASKVRGKKKGKRRAALGHDEPYRQCIACRTSAPSSSMLRFARHPDGAVVFDVRQKLPGRGAWLCVSASCLDKALAPKQGGFARAFDAAVLFDAATLRSSVQDALHRDLLDRLGLLRRQGALVLGRDDVVRRVVELLAVGLAEDIADNTRREMQERLPVDETRPLVALPSMAVLQQALGLDRAVGVVGLLRGLAARQVLEALRRRAALFPAPSTSAAPSRSTAPSTPT